MKRKSYPVIRATDELAKEVKLEKDIHKVPYLKLKETVFASTKLMISPHLFHAVIYLSPKYNNMKDGWSKFMKEALRRLGSRVNIEPLLRWSKEMAFDEFHQGIHYHLQIIGETKGSRFSYHLVQVLDAMKKDGYCQNFYINKPKSPKLGNIKASLRNPATALDMWNWLSYTTKEQTKEHLTGRLYGGSNLKQRLAHLDKQFAA